MTHKLISPTEALVLLARRFREERDEARAEVERLRAALERIRDMAERPKCLCGRPTGTAALKMAAQTALARTTEVSGG